MLLDPFEKRLDLPALEVQIGTRLRRNGEVVGQKVEAFSGQGVSVLDSAKRLRVTGCCVDTLVILLS